MEVIGKIEVAEEPKSFYEALACAMAEIPMFEKTNKVSFGKTNYSYIKLEEINAVVKPILAKYNLFITHKVENGYLTTSVVHASTKDGMVSHFKIDSNDPQKIGSLMTYGRRYNTCALLNIDCAGEDDDCVQLYNNRDNPEKLTENYTSKIENWLKTKDEDRVVKFWGYVHEKYEVKNLFDLTDEQIKELCNMIK